MNAKKMFRAIVILAIFALPAAGCSSAAASSPETVEIPASNVNFLIGVWEVEIDGQKWRMEMTDDGTMLVGTEGWHYQAAKGPYRLTGNRLYSEHAACDAEYDVTIVMEPGAEMPGLHFEVFGEDCLEERVEALDGKTLYPWPKTNFK